MIGIRYRKPAHVRIGDTVGIVMPAMGVDREALKIGVKKIEELGFRVKCDRSAHKQYYLLSSDDIKRAQGINRMFADKEVKAILCATGGYGAIRVIPYLDRNIIRRNPKIFIGYSDVTILLEYLQKTANMIVFHGPVVAGEISKTLNPHSLRYILKLLTEPQPLGELSFDTMRVVKHGRAQGTLVGGNMSLIMSATGTRYDINTDNKILFFEDAYEELETIDNYLMHFKLSGKFRKVKGVIFGRMVDCPESAKKSYNIKSILSDILKDVDGPVLYGFPSGHRMHGHLNVTLPLGVKVTVDTKGPTVTVEEPAVI